MSETQTQSLVQAKPKKQIDLSSIDNFLIRADINSMNEEQISNYIRKLCELVAINPITRPFDIMLQGGKKVIYANKGCAEQLRNIWGISIRIVKREVIDGVYTVTVAAQMGDRVDESTGCVWIEGLKGEARANAMMKAETKGKRRVTLSICGLNMPDDSEVDSIPGAKRGVLQAKPVDKLSQAQIARLFAIAKDKGIHSKEELKQWIINTFDFLQPFSLTELTRQEYDDVCTQLEKMEKKSSILNDQRRYALSAIVGVAPGENPSDDFDETDDDGNAASHPVTPKVQAASGPLIQGGIIVKENKLDAMEKSVDVMTKHRLRKEISVLVTMKKVDKDLISDYLHRQGVSGTAEMTIPMLESCLTWVSGM